MSSFRICLINHSSDAWLGGSYYVANIAAALEQLPHDRLNGLELVGLGAAPKTSASRIRWTPWPKAGEGRLRTYVGAAVRRIEKRSGIHNPKLHHVLRQIGADFAFPGSTGSYARVGYRTASWIADFQVEAAPQFSPPAYRDTASAYLLGTMRDSQRVVLSSQDSQSDAKRLYPRYSSNTVVMPFRAATILNARLPPPGKVRDRYNLPQDYFVVCNQFWRNKNHLGLFEAIKILKTRGVDVTVACTGRLVDPRDPEFSDQILRSISELGVANHVRLLGVIPRQDMLDLMRTAVSVVQPSLFEGWNTGVEEAHCLGRPLVLSNIPVHIEQAPSNATYFEATSPSALADALEAVWNAPRIPWDPETEQAALRHYATLVEAFGARFIEIATSVHAPQQPQDSSSSSA